MRVYVAGSTREKQRVIEVMRELMRHGHSITYDWTGSQVQWRDENNSYGKSLAESERDGVKNADGLVLLMPRADGSALDPGVDAKILKGGWIEFGSAAFDGKPCVVVSECRGQDSLFCQLSNVKWCEYDHQVPRFII